MVHPQLHEFLVDTVGTYRTPTDPQLTRRRVLLVLAHSN